MNRAIVAAGMGLVVTVVTFVLLRELTEDYYLAAVRGDSGRLRGPLLWMLALGIGLGLVAFASRYHPLLSAAPAVLLFLVYLPLLIDGTAPGWYPDWLQRGVLVSYGPAPYLVIGILGAASGWHLLVERTSGRPSEGEAP